MKTMRFATLLVAAFAALAGAARAETYPASPISVIVPYSPGNGLDALARQFAQVLQQQLGVAVVVENKEGAAGAIGTAAAARAPATGYTLLFTANPPFVISPLAADKPAYNPLTSFVPIARVGSVPLVLITAGNSQVKSFEQMVEFARKNPDKANYASAGPGSPGQLFGELLNHAAGLKLQEVPYRATGAGLTGVVTGDVLVSLVSVPAAAPLIKSGALRALAVGSATRLAALPDVPTLAEALKQPTFQASVWYGFFAPAGIPTERVEKLHGEIAKAGSTRAVLDFMERLSFIPEMQGPGEFANSLAKDVDSARKLISSAGLKSR